MQKRRDRFELQQLPKHGFLKLWGSVPLVSKKYFYVQLKKTNKQSNKQTDKQQVTEIECSKLFISLIISKSQFYIRDEGPRLVTCLPHRSFFLN